MHGTATALLLLLPHLRDDLKMIDRKDDFTCSPVSTLTPSTLELHAQKTVSDLPSLYGLDWPRDMADGGGGGAKT